MAPVARAGRRRLWKRRVCTRAWFPPTAREWPPSHGAAPLTPHARAQLWGGRSARGRQGRPTPMSPAVHSRPWPSGGFREDPCLRHLVSLATGLPVCPSLPPSLSAPSGNTFLQKVPGGPETPQPRGPAPGLCSSSSRAPGLRAAGTAPVGHSQQVRCHPSAIASRFRLPRHFQNLHASSLQEDGSRDTGRRGPCPLPSGRT